MVPTSPHKIRLTMPAVLGEQAFDDLALRSSAKGAMKLSDDEIIPQQQV